MLEWTRSRYPGHQLVSWNRSRVDRFRGDVHTPSNWLMMERTANSPVGSNSWPLQPNLLSFHIPNENFDDGYIQVSSTNQVSSKWTVQAHACLHVQKRGGVSVKWRGGIRVAMIQSGCAELDSLAQDRDVEKSALCSWRLDRNVSRTRTGCALEDWRVKVDRRRNSGSVWGRRRSRRSWENAASTISMCKFGKKYNKFKWCQKLHKLSRKKWFFNWMWIYQLLELLCTVVRVRAIVTQWGCWCE